jgi:flagellin
MGNSVQIASNPGAIRVLDNLFKTNQLLARTIDRLSSGLRVQSSADDPAGMAVSESLRAQRMSFQQAIRNANGGVAILQTAEAAFQSISDTLARMRELAVESANSSITDTERGFLDTEFSDMVDEIDRIAAVTEFNDIKLLDGSATTLTFQVGIRNSSNDRVAASIDSQSATSLGVNDDTVATQTGAQGAIDEIDTALESLNTDRASIGANINSLSLAVTSLSSSVENLGSAMGNIRDADIGSESAEFSRLQVLQQAGVAMLAQANALPSTALRLLA